MVQNAIKIAPFTPWRDPYGFPKKKKKKILSTKSWSGQMIS